MIEVCGTGYGGWKFNPTIIERKCKLLARDLLVLAEQYDTHTVVVRGTSGVAMLALMAVLTPTLDWVMVRKENETSHGYDIEGRADFDSYIFLDDFISTGATAVAVITKLKKAKCKAMLMHASAGESSLNIDQQISAELWFSWNNVKLKDIPRYSY